MQKFVHVMLPLSLVAACAGNEAPPAVVATAPAASSSPSPPAPAVSASPSASASASAPSSSAVAEKPLPPPTPEQLTCRDGYLAPYPEPESPFAGMGLSVIGADSASGPIEPGKGLGTAKGAGYGFLGGPPDPKTAKLVVKPKDATGARARSLAEGACAMSAALKTCRIETQKKGKLEGTLEVAIVVDDAGRVTTAKRSAGTIADGAFSACAETVLVAATFAKEAKGSATLELTVAGSARQTTMMDMGPLVTGKLPREIVRRVLRQKFAAFRACYEPLLKKDVDTKGAYEVELLIDENGKTIAVKDVGSTLTDKGALACLAKVARAVSFPKPEWGEVKARYRIEFANDLD